MNFSLRFVVQILTAIFHLDYIDNTNIINNNEIDTSIYFNDKNDDPLDLQINCFPDQFDKKIVEGINNNSKDLGCI